MLILGIETSCDETAVGIVECLAKIGGPRFRILANVLASQIPLHAPYFGVVPELASRAHLENITSVLKLAFSKAHLPFDPSVLRRRLRGVSFTRGPGLKGALLVGESAARSLALSLDKRALGVHHLEAHLAVCLIEYPQIRPPFIGLVVSGGHTDLIHVKRWGSYRVMGRTLDDACGEAFDKFAKMLKLGYPGGPIVDKMARQGDSKAVLFPRPYLSNSWDFSFSGLKTSALYWIRDHGSPKSIQEKNNLAASYQEAICDTLLFKTKKAINALKLNTVVVAGGVAANSRLRRMFQDSALEDGWNVYFPSPGLCTDNGVMTAVLGAIEMVSRSRPKDGPVDPSLPFPAW